MEFISQGAEARIYREKKGILKHRVKKSYRHPHIDDGLRKARTRREAKIINKLVGLGFPAPKLIACDDKERIVMEEIKGPRLRDVLEKKDYVKLSEEIGRKLAVMHNNHIIHGDLTTSNMILKKEIYFIDFGLSSVSHKIEDKAVDLHLLKQALESKHYRVWEKCFDAVLKAYAKEAKQSKEILQRLEQVEGRGRNKGKYWMKPRD